MSQINRDVKKKHEKKVSKCQNELLVLVYNNNT